MVTKISNSQYFYMTVFTVIYICIIVNSSFGRVCVVVKSCPWCLSYPVVLGYGSVNKELKSKGYQSNPGQ